MPLAKKDLNLEARRNIYDDKGKEITPAEDKDKQTNGEGAANGTDAATKAMETVAREPKKKINCFSCGIDCTRSRFHYAKSAPVSSNAAAPDSKYDLCPNCFLQARMPSSHHASDFVKLEDTQYTAIPDRDKPWSKSETLLLLEALENFDDNWRQISKHVGTRTPEECITKFLQLEIEEKYLEDPSDNSSALMHALVGRTPISQTENPVLSVITFLAQMAEPAVAAAAAGKSSEEIRNALRKQLEKETGGTESSDKKEKEGTAPKTEDSMEIDTMPEAESSDVATTEKPTDTRAGPANVALGLASARASGFASHEEREMTRLVGAAVNVMLQKFELKLAQFTELESVLDAERRELEQARHQLFLDRLAFKKRVKEVQDAFQAASLEGPDAPSAQQIDANTVGLGAERYTMQSTPGTTQPNVQPLSQETGADYRSYEL